MEDKDIDFLTEIIHKICDYAVETGRKPNDALEAIADDIKGLLSISTFNHWKKDCAENAQAQSCDCCKYISCHLNHGAIYCKLYGERNNSKACKSFVPDSEV